MRRARDWATHHLLTRAAAALGLTIPPDVVLDRRALVHVPLLVRHRLVDVHEFLPGHRAHLVGKRDPVEEDPARSRLGDDEILVLVVAALRLGALRLHSVVEVLEDAVGIPPHHRQLGFGPVLHSLGNVQDVVRLGLVRVSQIFQRLDASQLRLRRLDRLLELLADVPRALTRVLHHEPDVLQGCEDLAEFRDQSLGLLHRVGLGVVGAGVLRHPQVALGIEDVVHLAGAHERLLDGITGDASLLDLRRGELGSVVAPVPRGRVFVGHRRRASRRSMVWNFGGANNFASSADFRTQFSV